MKKMPQKVRRAIGATSVFLLVISLAGCAMAPRSTQVDAATRQVLQSSFYEQGEAKLDRLIQDESNRVCSEAAGAAPDEKLAALIEASKSGQPWIPAWISSTRSNGRSQVTRLAG